MCGRFTLTVPAARLVELFGVDDRVAGEIGARWNIAPSQDVLAVVLGPGGKRRLATMRWGLVPSWAKDPSIGNRLINARAETVAAKGAFRSAFARRRCLIPASGFYEWQAVAPGGVAHPRRRPFHLHAADGTPLALGGLWEEWRGRDGDLTTCTIVTTRPNAVVAAIHDRIPLVVPPAAWERWLAPEPLDAADQEALLGPAPDDLLVADPVSARVNSPRNDGPDLVEAVGP